MLSSLSISHTDPKQKLRMRRYFMAAGTCILVIGQLFIFHLQGLLDNAAIGRIVAMIVFWVLLFYGVFRTGFNRRSADASLTLPQMAAATLTILYAMYLADGVRTPFLIILVMILLFGGFRLTTRILVIFSCFPLIGYLAVIALLQYFKPAGIDVRAELLQWLTFASTLPWFAIMSGYTRGLRNRLHKSNAELQEALAAVQEREARLVEAQRIGCLGDWSFDPVSHDASWSLETYRIFGLDSRQRAAVGDDFRRLIHEDDWEHYDQLIAPGLRDGRSFDSQFRIVRPSGEIRWVHARGQTEMSAQGQVGMLRGTIADVTERKAAEEQIRNLAHFDSLTGLANRNLFGQLVAQGQARAERHEASLALVYIDLDGFKQVNDTLGHDAGDCLLREFGRRLRGSLRKTDTAARLGGDEFVALIEGFSQPSDLIIVAERILTATGKPFSIAGQIVHVSASLGISVYPDDGRDLDSLTRKADRAMYRAKHSGKNCFRFSSEVMSEAL